MPKSIATAHAPSVALLLVASFASACASGLPPMPAELNGSDVVERHAIAARTSGSAAEISYLRAGNADAQRVIFVHGTPGSATAWLDFLREDPADLEFVAIDRPGFGKTLPNRAVTSLTEQAAALEPLLVQRHGRWPILVGHSLGGPIVAAAAADYADRVDSIVIAAGALDPELQDPMPIQYLGSLAPFRWLLPTMLHHANREDLGLEQELRLLAPRLGSVRCPTRIVHGTEDELVPHANVDYMRRTLTGTDDLQVISLAGIDHFLPWNSQETLRRVIRALAAQRQTAANLRH